MHAVADAVSTPAARLRAWWDAHGGPIESAADAAAALAALVETGLLDLPLPGGGETAARLDALAALGEADLVLCRLAEGHADALAILAELGGPKAPVGSRWGVWAAEPPSARLEAVARAGGWDLTGLKAWCSGADACTHALVTAHADDGPRLFAVDLAARGVVPIPDTWAAVGMAASDSRQVRFDGVHLPAEAAVGGPGDYVGRPGFWFGAIGVAACWHGGARGVAEALFAAAPRREADPYVAAAVGAVDAALTASGATLARAAAVIDADPLDGAGAARLEARRARAVVEASAEAVLGAVGRALGAGPLCLDRAHAHRVADLTVYLRQSHGDHDLAALGRDVIEQGQS